MKAIHLLRGADCETLAAQYVTDRGARILARNLRCRGGELDLVCLDQGVLAIIEVRQRLRRDFGGALGSVTPGKQRKIVRATRFFMQRDPSWRTLAIRFDVLAVNGEPGTHEVLWIKDAFRT
jgi:putative endonuclease